VKVSLHVGTFVSNNCPLKNISDKQELYKPISI